LTGEGTREPGAFGFDPLGFSKDPTKRERYALSEIKNGRLAMIGEWERWRRPPASAASSP
jgi:hypothetical protein